MEPAQESRQEVSGEFIVRDGERFYAIRNVDRMPPFFISLVSDSDHWLFIASNGGLTAGRVSPNTALFPYVTVDKIYDSTADTGSKTILRVATGGSVASGTAAASTSVALWEPFNEAHNHLYRISRHLFKNLAGDRLIFEEINHDLDLAFRQEWSTSEEFGFVRTCSLENQGSLARSVEVLDGLQNLLPAGTPRHAQTVSSYLVDAYKWSELDSDSGLAFYTLFSQITDRAEPAESLRATTVFALGLPGARVLLSNSQLQDFRLGNGVQREPQTRGIRGAYFLHASLSLAPGEAHQWMLVADIEQSQADCIALRQRLANPDDLAADIKRSVESGTDSLRRIMGSGDAFQVAAEENLTAHHYANVLFNVLRGGIFDENYQVSSEKFEAHVSWFNRTIHQAHSDFFSALPERLDGADLLERVRATGDPQLERLCYEYLPIFFGRRHGDPSRPWNHFNIKLQDERGQRLLTYEGNWRDIFQNWEALLAGYPEFFEHVIAKFVNASTVDGYNPYRITNEGIDWEVEDPDDPWSYIGYWGDHQIIYLQKLLEASQAYWPDRLASLLEREIFSYANVPYRIKPLADLLRNAKDTVVYDEALAQQIESRVAKIGADGKLLLDSSGQVYRVTLLEKLIVPLLSKLSNLVIDGGIWLNTQRPEWNDANNALVGQGLSMVTLYYMRRYVTFLQPLIEALDDEVSLSSDVATWLDETTAVLTDASSDLTGVPVPGTLRRDILIQLGESASRYRARVYQEEGFAGRAARRPAAVSQLLDAALTAIDHSIATNRRQDGLYHAYNLLSHNDDAAEVETLYSMLEGQVAALSSGAIPAAEAADVLDTLFESPLYRADQNTFILYPDRDLPSFLEKNQIPNGKAEGIPLIREMLSRGDGTLIAIDPEGTARFDPSLKNAEALSHALDALGSAYSTDLIDRSRDSLLALYEKVFNHQAFTGRSGGMFGFEGLGSVYWHMVSKLLLAAQERFFAALEAGDSATDAKRLGDHYYRIRSGIGFNKTPSEYGAFPTDPYSHTPGHAGAQQPGMTGQVKEEMITRFGELGIRVAGGAVTFNPSLLRTREFVDEACAFEYLSVSGDWLEVDVPKGGLAFSWCQVPFVYALGDEPSLSVTWAEGRTENLANLTMPPRVARHLFSRDEAISQVSLTMTTSMLFGD